MKRFLFALYALLSVALMATPVAVIADNYGIRATLDQVNRNNPQNPLLPETVAGKQTVPEVIGQVVSIGLSLIGVVFFVLVLFSGFRWMTAMGNSEHVEKAKDTLITAAIGLLIVLAAYALTSLLFSRLAPNSTGSTGTTPTGAASTCAERLATCRGACILKVCPNNCTSQDIDAQGTVAKGSACDTCLGQPANGAALSQCGDECAQANQSCSQ
jgi:hypothetical protein